MQFKWRALSACVFTCSVATAGSAQAQFIDLNLRSSHAPYAPGMPQPFASTAATQSNGEPTAFDGAAVTQYSLEGTFIGGTPANGVTLPVGGQTIDELLALEPNVRLIPGSAGYDTTLTVYIASKVRTGLTPAVNALGLLLILVTVVLAIIYEIKRRRELTPKGV